MTTRAKVLTSEQRGSWETNGCFRIEGFSDRAVCDAMLARVVEIARTVADHGVFDDVIVMPEAQPDFADRAGKQQGGAKIAGNAASEHSGPEQLVAKIFRLARDSVFHEFATSERVVDLVAAPRWIPRIAGVGVVLGAAVFFAGSVRDALEPGATAMLVADREAGIWIRNNLEGSAVLGSWDAGALGYYSHRRVVSLDGEVGSVAFMRALRAGKTSEWDKSERVHVEYIVNHTFDEDGGSEKLRTLARDCFGEERTKRWTILWTWDFIYRGGANGKAPRTYGMAVWLARLD